MPYHQSYVKLLLRAELHRFLVGRALSGGNRIESGKKSSVASNLVAVVGAVAIRRSLRGEVEGFSGPFPVFRSRIRGSRLVAADAPREAFVGVLGISESWLVGSGELGFVIGSRALSVRLPRKMASDLVLGDPNASSRMY